MSKSQKQENRPFISFYELERKKSFLIGSILLVATTIFFSLSCGRDENPDEITALYEKEDLSIPELPYESKKIFRMHMNSLDDTYDSLEESIDRQAWEDIRTYAMEMNKSSTVLFTGKRKEDLPHDYILLDTRFHYHTLALVVASQEREMVSLNMEFEKVKKTCDDCHVRYKEKGS